METVVGQKSVTVRAAWAIRPDLKRYGKRFGIACVWVSVFCMHLCCTHIVVGCTCHIMLSHAASLISILRPLRIYVHVCVLHCIVIHFMFVCCHILPLTFVGCTWHVHFSFVDACAFILLLFRLCVRVCSLDCIVIHCLFVCCHILPLTFVGCTCPMLMFSPVDPCTSILRLFLLYVNVSFIA